MRLSSGLTKLPVEKGPAKCVVVSDVNSKCQVASFAGLKGRRDPLTPVK